MIHRLLDRLAERYSEREHKLEAMRAREEYFDRAGKVFDDDAELFEGRMASFLEWYVLERPLAGIGLTPVGVRDRGGRRRCPPTSAGRWPRWRRATAACSSCSRPTDQVLDVEDLIGGARFAVHERRKPLGMTAGDLFEARLVLGRRDRRVRADVPVSSARRARRRARVGRARRRHRRRARRDPVSPVAPAHPLAPARSRRGREGLSGCLMRPGAAPRGRALGGGGRWCVALAGVAYVAAANLYLIARASAVTLPASSAAPVRPYAIVLGNRVFPGGEPSPRARRPSGDGAGAASGRAGREGDRVGTRAARLRRAARDGGAGWRRVAFRPSTSSWMRAAIAPPRRWRTRRRWACAARCVVTQGYHLPRALYFARHAGIDALGVPAPERRAGWVEWLRVFVRETLARAGDPARG